MKSWIFWLLLIMAFGADLAADRPAGPDQIYGDFFADVQRAAVFPDQKTFVDCVPREAPGTILRSYREEKIKPAFDLNAFVHAHFLVPETRALAVPAEPILAQHIRVLWPLLRRDPDQAISGSSLLPLPFPYIVPGGRFREIYYWDSYFTMLGLRESSEEVMIHDLVENFSYLESTYDHIPNGNRTYYLSRSQPPFFALMIDLLAEKEGAGVYRKYLSALEKEYAYWTDRSAPTQHSVKFSSGAELTRYYDQSDTPRPEAFAKEEAVARRSNQPHALLYRQLRSTAESGWDFSSRWFADGKSLETIQTLDLVPVDLNCLIQHLEVTLARAYRENGDPAHAAEFAARAERRRTEIVKTFWSAQDGYFFDFNLRTEMRSGSWTLAGVAPLFFKLATPEQAKAVASAIRGKFLRPGGVVTTLVDTGQQWDAPNGWAPLQWLTVQGLENYGYRELAAEIAHRWLALNEKVYRQTGKMMEKYNVVDLGLTAGGGEYPSQDGFGWTNGVYLKLHDTYDAKP